MTMRKWFDPRTWFRGGVDIAGIHPSNPAIVSLFGGQSYTAAGVPVTDATALMCSAWWSGIRLLSDSAAMLEMELKGVASPHPVAKLLAKPCRSMTRFTFIQTLMHHALARGNGFAEILINQGSGRAGELALMDPRDIKPEWSPDGSEKLYRSQRTNRVWHQSQIIHIPGLGFDGLTGYSVQEYAKQAIGLDLGAEKYGASWYGSGGRPSGTLEHPGELSPEAAQRAKTDWYDIHQPGSHRIALLQEGLKFNAFENDPSKSQALETRKFQISVVARFLRVPPHMLYDAGAGVFATIEAMGREFLTYSLGPWLTLIEEEAGDKLLTDAERDAGAYVHFREDNLVRTDGLQRSQKREIDINCGVMTLKEARDEEGLPFIAGTDQIRVPLNYGTLQADGSISNNAAGQPLGNVPTVAKRDAAGLGDLGDIEDETTTAELIAVPDVRQPDNYSCGAAASMGVGQYFGVGPDDLDEWKALLGTIEDKSTRPMEIVRVLSALGLTVEVSHNMTVDDLAEATDEGSPVICPIAPGHYVTVVGVAFGFVFVQDSAATGSTGVRVIDATTWVAGWVDTDIDGNVYTCFGISVSQEGDDDADGISVDGIDGITGDASGE